MDRSPPLPPLPPKEVNIGAITMFRPSVKNRNELMTIRSKNDKIVQLYNVKRPFGSTNVLGGSTSATGSSRLLIKPKSKMTIAYELQEKKKQEIKAAEVERQKLIFSPSAPNSQSSSSSPNAAATPNAATPNAATLNATLPLLSKDELRMKRLSHFS